MARFYAIQVVLGRITIEKVPKKYRDAVVKILQEMDAKYNTGL